MDKTIYNIENRGYCIIGHWFFFMLAGLLDITNGNPIEGSNCSIYRLNHNVFDRNIKINGKIKICFNNQIIDEGTTWKSQSGFQSFNFESLKIISNKFELITDINKYKDKGYQIINHYGCVINNNHNYPFVKIENIKFVRNLFLENTNYNYDNNKYIYISRKKAITCKNSPSFNVNRRTVLNENTLFNNYLSKLGFNIVYLEDYSVENKIKLFNTSSIIISPFGGALTFTIFANKNTNIIEISSNFKQVGWYGQWEQITRMLNIPYIKYITNNIDNMDNMTVNEIELYNKINNIIHTKQN